MKIGFIFVLYNTPESERSRLKHEVKMIGARDSELVFIDNTGTGRGYAAGVNRGVRQAIDAGCDVFCIMNPDISLKGISREDLLCGSKYFDIWGLAMRQHQTVYYGGDIDQMRLSGGLNSTKPKSRFSACDFVSGSLFLMKRGVWDKIGEWDESYGMYYEEVDYCIRAKNEGCRIGVDTGIYYEHFENSKTSEEKKYLLARNRLRVLLRYGGFKQRLYEFLRAPLTVFEEPRIAWRIFRENRFLYNFASLNISSFANKLLTFALYIVLVKLFDPARYGVYALVWAQVGLLGPFIDSGTTNYGLIYSPGQPLKRLNALFSMRVFIAVLSVAVTIGAAFLFHYPAETILYIALASVLLIANAFSGSFLVLSSIIEKVYLSSLYSFVFNLCFVAATIIALMGNRSLTAVFIVAFAGYSAYAVANAVIVRQIMAQRKASGPLLSFQPRIWWEILRKSYIFVLIGLFANIYFKADIFLLNFMKGPEAVGIYQAGYKFLEAIMFIAASYNVTAAPVFARLKPKGTEGVLKKIRQDAVLLSGVGFGIAAAMFVLGPFVLPLVLSGEFASAIAVARIVIFALPFILLSSIFLNLLYIYNKPHIVVLLFIAQFAINIILNIMFIPSYSYMASSYATVASELINLIILAAVTVPVVRGRSYQLPNHSR